MNIVNLTPHDIVVRVDGQDITYPASGQQARLSTDSVQVGTLLGVPVDRDTKGTVTGLPDPKPDTVYLVSGQILDNLAGRQDVFAPGTGPKDGAIRNEKGHITAVTRLKTCKE